MKLSPRLETVVSALDLPGQIADIGTDHAQIPIYLARETNCSLIVATEYKDAPYQTALKQLKKAKVKDKVELRRGSGLSPLNPGEIEETIISGMGGETIRKIIAGELELARQIDKFILQPMNKLKKLRKWLVSNGFKLTAEKISKERGNFYQVLEVKAGKMEIKDGFLLEIGPRLIENDNPLVGEFLDHLESKWQGIIKKLARAEGNEFRRQQFEKKVKRLKEVKKWRSN